MKRVMSDGVLQFECPKCGAVLHVGLHVNDVFDNPSQIGPNGVHYGHQVEFTAVAPHLHAEFWGHLVRCHQPDPHPYMSPQAAAVPQEDT